jgi:putative holliday junction resolvase
MLHVKMIRQRKAGRVLALDVGKKRIGLAVSDALGITAQGLPTLQRTRIRDDLKELAELCEQYEVGLLLLGNPLHMSGAESRQAEFVREFGERLGNYTGLAVEYWDERLTTVEATRVLRDSGISLQKRKAAVDRLSAVLILEAWLEHQGSGGPAE